jgi:CheY-like chemotaxis protein
MARILVIEDEPLVAHLIRQVLARSGHEVRLARSGEEGLGSLEGVDLVLCDLVLPGLSGQETIRRIRAQGGPPVVALSASVTPDKREGALAAGAVAFLGKPFEPQELLRLVEEALRRKDS